MKLQYKTSPCASLQGEINAPGDKSISHRILMLGAIAQGPTSVTNLLNSADCQATQSALQSMGVKMHASNNSFIIEGVGSHGLQNPNKTLDLGNSGTSMRLFTGLLSGQNFSTTLTGDPSLQKRPMKRVVAPLTQMGAHIQLRQNEFAPIAIDGVKSLQGISYSLPVASAQIKSSLLLASLYAQGEMLIREPAITRDHTERLLQAMGVELQRDEKNIRIVCGQKLHGLEYFVPGDLSSVAFFLVAASICPNSKILLRNVGVNPTRTGILTLLQKMGANVQLLNSRMICGEPVADIQVISAQLRGIEVSGEQVSLAIDEFPAFFIAAACAQGKTQVRGAQELRVKESDRIHVMAQGLKSLGIRVEEFPDGLVIEGGRIQGGRINCDQDHRVAMAFAVAGLIARDQILIEDCRNVKTSFPNFVELANHLGFQIEVEEVM